MTPIINANDFGLMSSVNKAIVECFAKGLINQTTIMVNMSHFNEAVYLAKKHGFADKVGIHLNIDAGYPLTEKIKVNRHFCNADGEFNGAFKHLPFSELYLNRINRACLSEELDAQSKKYVESGFTLMHFDSHHHNHMRYSVLKLLIPLAQKYSFKSCSIPRNLFVQKQSKC